MESVHLCSEAISLKKKKKAGNHESSCVRIIPKAILEKWLNSSIDYWSHGSISFISYPDKNWVQEVRIVCKT